MGKNRNIKSLIELIANTIAHTIVEEHTNRPESKHFLSSEVIEYGAQARKAYKLHHWNIKEKEQIREKAIEEAKKRLKFKYPDVSFQEKEVQDLVDKELVRLSA